MQDTERKGVLKGELEKKVKKIIEVVYLSSSNPEALLFQLFSLYFLSVYFPHTLTHSLTTQKSSMKYRFSCIFPRWAWTGHTPHHIHIPFSAERILLMEEEGLAGQQPQWPWRKEVAS